MRRSKGTPAAAWFAGQSFCGRTVPRTTEPLPMNWRAVQPVAVLEPPAPSAAMRAESHAVTERIPCFGGDEVRS